MRPISTSLKSQKLHLKNFPQIGAAQIDHGHAEVKDLGWNDHPSDVPAPLVGGLPNEELWTLIRRFNKVDSHTFEHIF